MCVCERVCVCVIKQSTFLNSIHSEVMRFIRSLERIKDKIDRKDAARTHTHTHTHTHIDTEGCPRGVMVKAIDCRIVVSEFELQSRYCVHFRTNTLGKGMKSLILPTMG